MARTLLRYICALALIASITDAGASAQGIEYFGYYGVPTTPQLDLLKDHANLVQVDSTDFALIDAAAAKGMKSWVSNVLWNYLLDITFDPVTGAPVSVNCTALRSSMTAFNTYAGNLDPHIQHVVGFYLMDEPFGNLESLTCTGSSPVVAPTRAQITELLRLGADVVKNRFLPGNPAIKLAVVEDPRIQFPDVLFPANIDWIGFDCYPRLHGGTFEACGQNPWFPPKSLQQYIDILKLKLTASQRIVLVPEAFVYNGTPPSHAPTPQQVADLGVLTDKFTQLAYQEPKIVAVIPFVGPDFGPVYGAMGMPTVFDRYKAFGKSVLTNVALNKAVTGAAAPAYPASNLTDGSSATMAYPADYSFEYSVALGAPQWLHRVELAVQQFGTTSPYVYITSWSLYGTNPGGSESLIASGGSPGGTRISAHVNGAYTHLRVQAASTHNWIGVYELRAFGAPVAAALTSVTTTTGTVSAVGVPITWTAAATTSTSGATIEYKYSVYNASTTTWVYTGGWVSSNTFAYTPGSAGVYHVQVLVRIVGSSVTYDDWRNSAQITVNVVNATISSIASTAGSTSPVGVPITWTVSAAAAGLPIEYKFMAYEVSAGWLYVGNYGSSNVFMGTPPGPGTYHIQVWVRVAGKTVSYDNWQNSAQVVVP